MKHRISFYLTYACLVLFASIGVLLLLLGEKAPRESESENRMLSGFPALSAQSVGDGSFMAGLESYLSDGMPARERIVFDTALWMNALSLDRESHAEEELFEAIGALAEDTDPAPTPEEQDASADVVVLQTAETTRTPAPLITEVPAQSETPEAPGTPEAPAAQQPTATPKPQVRVETCTFKQIRSDGTFRKPYTFPKENIENAIRVLNAYREVLPEDGHLFFTQIPFPAIAFSLQDGSYVGWECDLEGMLAANTAPGTEIVSTLEVLGPHLLAGEDLYFHTDHHWKPRAACYVAQAMLARLGIDAPDYDAYSYRHYNDFYGSLAKNHPELKKTTPPDTIDVLIPSLPVKGYTIAWNGKQSPCKFMVTDRHAYMAYLSGTQGPWRYYETGVDCGRKCLVIGDSYLCCFAPYLAPFYEELHTVDFRPDYYKNPRWTAAQYIREHEIDDVYVILSTASGINASYMLQLMLRYL